MIRIYFTYIIINKSRHFYTYVLLIDIIKIIITLLIVHRTLMLLDVRSKSSMQINWIHVNECKCTYKRITLYFSTLKFIWEKKKNYKKILVTLISYNFPFLWEIAQDRRTRRSKPLLTINSWNRYKITIIESRSKPFIPLSLSSPRFQHHHYINKCKRSKIWVYRMANDE